MDFDPNLMKAPPKPEWATFIPDRHPKWKIHNGLGQAKNAFQYKSNVILYHFEDDKWIEKYRIEDFKKEDNCYDCNQSLIKNDLKMVRQWNVGTVMWKKAPEIERITVCHSCERVRRKR